ncbi:hypothetical protein CEXT_257121 [Caerostris extrusa]|uniref:Uncharacterized protein n=1 Tax=Caerostris extrusa TaxID=172846 RepID=A0AAV4X802_CAEEX|nr:hypothetical protein CEXT_257121 [Caerostris extrusa]
MSNHLCKLFLQIKYIPAMCMNTGLMCRGGHLARGLSGTHPLFPTRRTAPCDNYVGGNTFLPNKSQVENACDLFGSSPPPPPADFVLCDGGSIFSIKGLCNL